MRRGGRVSRVSALLRNSRRLEFRNNAARWQGEPGVSTVLLSDSKTFKPKDAARWQSEPGVSTGQGGVLLNQKIDEGCGEA